MADFICPICTCSFENVPSEHIFDTKCICKDSKYHSGCIEELYKYQTENGNTKYKCPTCRTSTVHMNTVKKYLDNLIEKKGNLMKPTNIINSCCFITNKCFNWLNKRDNDGNTYGANIVLLIFIFWMAWVHYVTDYKIHNVRSKYYNDCINNISYINESNILYNNSVYDCRNQRFYFSNANNAIIVGFCLLYTLYCLKNIKYPKIYSVISYCFSMILQISLIYYIMIDTNFGKYIKYPAVELFAISLMFGGLSVILENVIEKLHKLYTKNTYPITYDVRDGHYFADQNESSNINTNVNNEQLNDYFAIEIPSAVL